MDHAALMRLRETKFAADIERVRLDGTFAGYASIFLQRDLGNDIVAPGAFAKSLARRGAGNIRMLYQHDPGEPIGVWDEIGEDAHGLRVVGRLARNVERGREVHELMRAGAIDGLSIGFRTIRAARDKTTGARRILEADLWEISVVTFPMQPGARVETVKATTGGGQPGRLPSIRQFERWLTRDAGLTRGQARTVIAKGYCQLEGLRDAAPVPHDGLAGRIRLATRAIRSSIPNRKPL